MQNPFQPPQSLLKLAIVLFFLTNSLSSARAEPFLIPAAADQASEVNFLSGGPLKEDSFYQAGLEIVLAPGAITYWRTPGDAGVPPVFDFEGSQNLEKAQVFYPVPQRLDEAGETAFGYKDRVVFPVHVTPKESGQPIELKVRLAYAVCTKVCLPETARLSVELGPGQKTSHSIETELSRAEKALPKPLTVAQAAIFARLQWNTEESLKTGLPAWRFTWHGAAPADLFIEGPEGWYFKTGKTSDPQIFILTAVDHPKDEPQSLKPRITVTVLEKDQSFEFKTELKARAEPN